MKSSLCCDIYLLAFKSSTCSLTLPRSLAVSLLCPYQPAGPLFKGKGVGSIPNVNSLPLSPDLLGPTCLDKALIDIQTL